jgi:hypothetical protein
LLFDWWGFSVFLADFLDSAVQVRFKFVAHVFAFVGVYANCDGKFARYGTRDFSPLPSLGVMN